MNCGRNRTASISIYRNSEMTWSSKQSVNLRHGWNSCLNIYIQTVLEQAQDGWMNRR